MEARGTVEREHHGHHGSWKWPLFILTALVVAGMYFGGRLDHALYPVGLNFNTCARNGFGATFCGSELTQYQERVRGVQQQIRAAQQRIQQLQSSAGTP